MQKRYLLKYVSKPNTKHEQTKTKEYVRLVSAIKEYDWLDQCNLTVTLIDQETNKVIHKNRYWM